MTHDTGGGGEVMIREAVDDGFATVLPLRQRGELAPLFCVHPGIGVSWCYTALCGVIPQNRPIYALQARALRTGGALGASISDLATDYLEEIRAIQPTGPYHLLGFSLGGFVAHEIATALRAAGERVGLLAIVDIFPGDGRRYGVGADEPARMAAFLRELGAPTATTELSRANLWENVCGIEGAEYWWDRDQVDRMFDVFANSCAISARFEPGHFDGDVLLFSAAVGVDRKHAVEIGDIVSLRLAADDCGG
jgi:pimeloyl-ACP methyl ester carboxylesterase